MIYIDNIRKPQASEVWAIVRSLKSPGKMIWVPDLSPTQRLFYQYLKWRDAGLWNEKTFQELYAPQFLKDAKANPNFEKLIAQLQHADHDISLICFCTDETLCHRSIVAGILQGLGTDVTAQHDYSQYFQMYQNI